MIYLMLVVNFAIAWLNCWSCGRSWAESKALGGWVRLLTWCGAVQAAVGFSSVAGALIGAVAMHLGYLPPLAAAQAMDLWYLLIIVPVLGSGLILMIESWIHVCRERTLSNMTEAAWNTYAQIHNTYGALQGMGSAFDGVKNLFSMDSDDPRDSALGVVLFIVALALGSGFLLTAVLIRRYASTLPVSRRSSSRAVA